jgi:hypothetical protein
MNFPRIKEFDFEINRIYNVPANRIGRLDLISYELYGNYNYYKALAAANNIRFITGSRTGIRPMREAIESELSAEGVTGTALTDAVNAKMDAHQPDTTDWNYYGDGDRGIISQVYEGKTLKVPTFESARGWMNRFEYLGT